MVAKELEIPVESVTFETLDTGKVGPDTGVGASRATRIFGSATQMAAADARQGNARRRGHSLGITTDGLTYLALAR